MDIADQSDTEIENYIVDTVMNNTRKGIKNDGLIPKGICHNENCEEDIPRPKLFCDGKCASEHHAANRRYRR